MYLEKEVGGGGCGVGGGAIFTLTRVKRIEVFDLEVFKKGACIS